jgi:hypothetical protein
MANELQKKYGYIYCTTDLKNGMKYIGQKKSNKFIQTYFGSGTLIKKIIKKRPETLRLDLIEWCYSQEELNNCENNWTNAIGLYPLSYNLVQGGGTTTGYKHSEVTKIKISEKHKGQTSWNKGIKQSEETIEKRRLKLIGKKRTEEVKIRISEGNKCNKNCIGRI